MSSTSGHAVTAIAARALALCAMGAAIGLGVGAIRPGGLQLRAAAHAASCEAPAVEPTVVTPTEAAQICAQQRSLIADARPANEFASGHIAGAVHLPCDARGDVAGAALSHLTDRSLVLVYGTDTADALAVARSIAQRLPSVGGPTIYALRGGFAAWEKAGLACASGPCEGCSTNLSAPEQH